MKTARREMRKRKLTNARLKKLGLLSMPPSILGAVSLMFILAKRFLYPYSFN